MKKHLIIALGEKEDIHKAALSAQHILRKYPRDAVEIVVFEHMKKMAEAICGIQSVHSIDCSEINRSISGHYYSDMYAFNSFIAPLSPLFEESWEQVVNCSTSKVAAHLTSVFTIKDNARFTGTRMGRKGNMLSSDLWSLIELTQNHYAHCSYISQQDIIRNTYRTTLADEASIIKLDDTQSSRAFQMLQKVRQANPANCRLVGIPLFNAHHDTTFSFERIVETIGTILDDIGLFPIIITSSADRDRVFAKQVSKHFANSLLILETDQRTLPAALVNLDAVVGGHHFATTLSDLLGTATLKLVADTEMLLSTLPYGTNQLTLVSSDKTNSTLIAADIHTSLKHLLGDSPALDSISLSSALYTCKKDDFGHYALQLAGLEQQQFNLQYYLIRSLISLYSNHPVSFERIVELTSPDLSTLTQWGQQQRSAITLASRELLGTLRSLLRTQKDRQFIGEFVNSLDKLFKHSEANTLASFCCNLFKARVDGIEESSYEENLARMEKSLYQLKDDLQAAIGLIKKIEDFTLEQQKANKVQAVQSRQLSPA